MDWIQIGTLISALVAAGAAIWGAIISTRQLRIALAANEHPLPLIEAELSAMVDQPAWSVIGLTIRNEASVAIDLVSAKVKRPKGVLLLSPKDAFGPADDWRGQLLLNPLPVASAAKEAQFSARISRRGSQNPLGATFVLNTTLYAHRPISDFGDRPSLSLEMRWRDQTTKTFAIAVNVIKPSTM